MIDEKRIGEGEGANKQATPAMQNLCSSFGSRSYMHAEEALAMAPCKCVATSTELAKVLKANDFKLNALPWKEYSLEDMCCHYSDIMVDMLSLTPRINQQPLLTAIHVYSKEKASWEDCKLFANKLIDSIQMARKRKNNMRTGERLPAEIKAVVDALNSPFSKTLLERSRDLDSPVQLPLKKHKLSLSPQQREKLQKIQASNKPPSSPKSFLFMSVEEVKNMYRGADAKYESPKKNTKI